MWEASVLRPATYSGNTAEALAALEAGLSKSSSGLLLGPSLSLADVRCMKGRRCALLVAGGSCWWLVGRTHCMLNTHIAVVEMLDRCALPSYTTFATMYVLHVCWCAVVLMHPCLLPCSAVSHTKQVCIYCTLLPLRESGGNNSSGGAVQQLPPAVAKFMEAVAAQAAVKAGTEQVCVCLWLVCCVCVVNIIKQ